MFSSLERLSEIIFLEIKNEAINNLFKVETKENISLPIRSKRLIDDVKNNININNIPIFYFIEGMVYLIGCDPEFRLNTIYKRLLTKEEKSIFTVKKLIYDEIKSNNMEDVYILLNGLVEVEPNAENYEKLLIVVKELTLRDKDYLNEEKRIIESGKLINNFPLVYFYEALLKKEEENYEAALFSLRKYAERGGEITEEIKTMIDELVICSNYEKGIELSIENPEEALKLLVPLLESLPENPSLYFHIAVCYRNIKSFEKAIYYLNEAISLDSNIMEIFNEFGLNYASLGDYDNAIKYFRKAFEITKSLEICTNLVLCYYNNGDIEQAKLHLQIAKKLDVEDEIVKKLDKLMNKNI